MNSFGVVWGQLKNSMIDCLAELYSTINAPDRMTDALDRAASITKARGVIQFSYNETGFQYLSRDGSSLYIDKGPFLEQYAEKHGAYDAEANNKLMLMPNSTPLFDCDIWPDHPNLLEREDYASAFEALGIFRKVGFNLSPDVGWKAGVIFQYGIEWDFAPSAGVAMAQSLTPHLSKVIELGRFVSQLHQKYQAVLSVLDHLNLGVCITDETGNLLVSNLAATRIFKENDGLRHAQDRVRFSDGDLQGEYDKALKNVASTAAGSGQTIEHHMVVKRRSLRLPYLLTMSPIADGSQELEKGFAGAVIMVFDTEDPPNIDVGPMAALSGLTVTEKEIVKLLFEGYSDRQVADIRSVSLETTRGQIKQILRKAGVNNRVSLLRRAALIAPSIS
ncbi:helix-turn-helix transcriptional regulator [Roseibium sp. SCP14]|uniref:helix-turn-helix transcriptional regulator n=1 Tax=Roseibium sp. SCP14 TaxID=3141375 RepID=UPI0033398462